VGSVSLKVDNKPAACPAFPFIDETYRRGVHTHGDRVSLGKRFGSRETQTYSLEFEDATEGQARDVRLAFQAAGTTKAVNWIPPKATAIVEVLFIEDTLEIEEKAPGVYDIRFELEEAIR